MKNNQNPMPSTWEEFKNTFLDRGDATGQAGLTKSWYEASGIGRMQEDVFSLLDEGESYFGGTGDAAGYLSRVQRMRSAIGKQREYFSTYAANFAPEELQSYNEALDAWDEQLSSYASAISTGSSARQWLSQKDMVFEGAFTPKDQSFRASSRTAAEWGLGSGLDARLTGLQETAKKWTQTGYRPTAQERQQFQTQIDEAKSELAYSQYYFGQNSAYFSADERKQQEAYYANAAALTDYAQKYLDSGSLTNPLTGGKVPTPIMSAVDVDDDGAADMMYPGGELQMFRDEQSGEKLSAEINRYIERSDYESQDQGQFSAYFSDSLAVAQGEGGTFIRGQEDMGGGKTVYYVGERQEGSVSEVLRRAAFQDAVQRLWYAAYTHNVDRETFDKMVDELYSTDLAKKYEDLLPEKKDHFGFEYEYNYSMTREALPHKSTGDLLEFTKYLAEGSKYTGEYTITEGSGMMLESAIAYLANKEMSQEEQEEFLRWMDIYKKKAAEEPAQAYTIDFDKYIAQRQANGTQRNEKGLEAALDIYPDFNWESYVDLLLLGGTQGVENIAKKYSGVAEEIGYDIAGAGYTFLGALTNGFGLFNNDAGEWLLDKGAQLRGYESEDRKEAEYAEYVRNREVSEVMHNASAGWESRIASLMPSIGSTLTEMSVAGVIGRTAAAFVPQGAMGKGVQTVGKMYAAKNAARITMSSFALMGAYAQNVGKDATEIVLLKSLGAGLLEYATSGMFGGNKLIDAEDAEKVGKWVQGWMERIQDNPVFRKIIDSKLLQTKSVQWLMQVGKKVGTGAGEAIGEGIEEVASSIGNDALNYVLSGKSELTMRELEDEFMVGAFISIMTNSGSAAGEVIGRTTDYIKVAGFSKFNHASRKSLESLNTQMYQYAIDYFAGDAELMRANGWDDAQIAKAQKEWKNILNEYNTAYVQMVRQKKITGTENARPSVESLISHADGSFGDVSAQHFTPGTTQEDVDSVVAVYQKMEDSATKLVSAVTINANMAKMAQVAMQNLDIALDEGYIGQLQYDNYKAVLYDIYEESSGNLAAYLDAVYAPAQNVAQEESVAERTDAETNVDAVESVAENAVATTDAAETFETEQKNMTAEPSDITGGMENAEVLNDSSQRDEGLGTGGQAGSVAESTSRSVAAGQARTETAILSNLKKNGTAQSARSIGVHNGSEDASLYVLSDEDIAQSEQWQSIKADAEADGANVVLFAGDLKVYNPTKKKYARVEGVHRTDEYGNTTYYIKVDKLSRSAQQIYTHEKFHEIVSVNPEMLGDLVRALEAKYGRQEIAALVNSYVEAYDGIYGRFSESMTEKQVDDLIMQYMNEVFADVYAGIHRGGANTAKAKQIMDSQTTEIQRAAQNRKAMQNKNAPPEQRYSLEGYSEHELENWKNSKRIIVFRDESQLRKFVSDASKGINSNKKIYFGKVSRELAQRIYAETGIDVEGFNCSLSGYEIQKILKDHGNEEKEALRGQRAITEDDFVNIPMVIQSPDAILLSPKLYNGKPVLEFEKNVNGKVNVTAYVSDKHIDLIVQTMYANKKSGSLAMPTDERASANTPEANNGTTSTEDTLTEGYENVKQEFSVEGDKARLEDRVQGDDYLNAMDLIDEITAVGAEVDENGYVTVYHRTNDAAATVIRKTGVMQAKEDGLFFSTNRDGSNNYGYGDSVITLKVPAEKLVLDDIFDDEASVKIPLENRRRMNVSEYIVSDQNSSTQQFSFEDDARSADEDVYFESDLLREMEEETGINANSSEEERYEILKDARIAPAKVNDEKQKEEYEGFKTKTSAEVKQEFSFEDDVAELDAQYARHMAEDDTPEGLAPDDDQISDYHALAKEEKQRRAKNATTNQLKNRIKSSEKAIAAHREAKDALKNIGGLTKEAAEQLDQKIKLIRETMQIDREALKEKQAAEEKYKKQERKEKEEAEIREQKAKIAQKELRQDLLNLFSVKPGVRFEMAQEIDRYSDELLKSGRLTNESRRELFELLYEHGEEISEADEYFGNIRQQVQQGRVYVSESVRAEFGDDWESFRNRAWGNCIYLTNNQNDIGIDVWTDELAGIFGGAFDASADLKTQLETIVHLAEEGKAEKLTIAEMMQRNEDNYGWSVEEQMDELERKVDRMLETFAQKADLEIRLRQESVRKLLNDREYFNKKMERNRERRMESEARNQVLKRLHELETMLKKASPAQKSEIMKAIKDIDTLSRKFSARGIENIQYWAQLYYEQKHALGADFLENKYVEERLGRLGKLHLDDLSIEDVVELGKMAMAILHTIRENGLQQQAERKFELQNRANKAKQEILDSKGSKDGKLHRYRLEHLDAKRFFGEISGWKNGEVEALGKSLSDGQERMQHYQLNAMRIFDDFLAKDENRKWLEKAAGKKADWETIHIDGCKELVNGKEVDVSSIEITPMMRVSLLMHSLNEDNLWHIGHVTVEENGDKKINGGLTIPDKKYYKKGDMKNAFAKGRIIKMPPSAVKQIANSCSPQEKAFAELLGKYFDGYAKAHINEVSLKMEGFERATMERYFPILSDKAFIVTKNDLLEADRALNFGWLRERTHVATNPIYLLDATDVLMKNIGQVSSYYGYALALKDLDAVMNATYYKADRKTPFSREEINFGRNKEQEGWGLLEGTEHVSLKKVIEQKWGSSATDYIKNLKKDIINSERGGNLISNFAARLRGNYAQAVIAANLSSLMKQTTSYPVALPYLKVGGLIHGLKPVSEKNLSTLEKYSAVYWYRNLGNSTMELSDALNRGSFGDKLPWLFNATQKMDSFTTRRILAACEYRVQHDMKLKPGTQEEIESGTDRYWMEVAKLFNEVVLKTQSNSTTMEKPQITRAGAGNISRFFTMFRTDAFQQYNMMVEAFGRLNAAKQAYKNDSSAENKKALAEAKKFTARTITGIVSGQMGCVLVAMLLKVARFDDDEFRDKDGDLNWGKIALYFGSGVVEGFSGFLVGAEILYSAAEIAVDKFIDGDARWWDIEATGLSTINDSIDAVLGLIEAVADGKFSTGKAAFRKAAIALSKGFGFPLENLEKYLLMTTRWLAPEWAEKHQNFWEEIDKNNLSKESMKTIDEAIGVLMDNRTDGLSRAHKEEIARLYVAGGVGAVPTAIPTSVSYTKEDGEEVKVELNGKQQEKYRKVWRNTVSGVIGELLSSDEYEKADDEGKAELLDKLYKYANQIAQNAVVPEKEIDKWVLQGQNAVNDGIPLEEYICFRIGLNDISGKNASGESVDGLKAQRCMEYLDTMGWSDEQEKNIYLDVLASESKKKHTEALMAAGLSWEQTNDIVSILGDRKWEHMNAIIRTNASEKVKVKAMEVYASDKEKLLIRTGYEFGVKLEWYAEVRNKADADGSGNISQEEAENYIDGMDLSIQEKAYLWQMVTDGKEGKKNPFSDTFGREFWYEAHDLESEPDEEQDDDIGSIFDSSGGIFGTKAEEDDDDTGSIFDTSGIFG